MKATNQVILRSLSCFSYFIVRDKGTSMIEKKLIYTVRFIARKFDV